MKFTHSEMILGLALLTLSLLAEFVRSAPSFDVVKELDAEKFQKPRWWVTHRAQRLRKGHLDRCLAVTFNRRFKDHQMYIEIDHENSGVIDQAYYPTDFDQTGFSFKMEGDEVVRMDAVDTDYETYFIGYLSFKIRKDEFLFTWANVPKPEGELLAKMSARLMEITGVGMDALEPVDNADCPEPAR